MKISSTNGWQQAPTLNGLVLAGGKSLRMGKDKGALLWHGTEQRLHLAGLLQRFCTDVFLSCRPDQLQELAKSGENLLPDVFENLGPCGALLSAFEKNPHCAWLVTACDLPLLDAETLLQLVSERDPVRMATAFESPFDGLPEPLVTIWEPGSYPILLASLEKRCSSLRKTLMNQDVKMIRANNSNALLNVNTPQEMDEAQQLLAKGKPAQDAN